jgi:hypothetical protein
MEVTIHLPDDLLKEITPYLSEGEDFSVALSNLVQEALRGYLHLWPSPAAALLELAGIVSQPGVHAEEGAEDNPNPAPDHLSLSPQRGQYQGY